MYLGGVCLQVTMLRWFPGELQTRTSLLDLIKPSKPCCDCRNIKVMFCLDQPFLVGQVGLVFYVLFAKKKKCFQLVWLTEFFNQP